MRAKRHMKEIGLLCKSYFIHHKDKWVSVTDLYNYINFNPFFPKTTVVSKIFITKLLKQNMYHEPPFYRNLSYKRENETSFFKYSP